MRSMLRPRSMFHMATRRTGPRLATSGRRGFAAGSSWRKGVLRRESRRWGRAAVGAGGLERVTRASKERRAGFSVFGEEASGQVWDSMWTMVDSWAEVGMDKKRKREKITLRR